MYFNSLSNSFNNFNIKKNIIDKNIQYEISVSIDFEKNVNTSYLYVKNSDGKIISTKSINEYSSFYNEVSNSIKLISNFISDTETIYVYILVDNNTDNNESFKVSNIKFNKINNQINKMDIFDIDSILKKEKSNWKKSILPYIKINSNSDFLYPLIENTYNEDEIIAMIGVLLGNKLTMGNKVSEFEKEFAKKIGSKYAVMVNSGSSANLLALSVLCNKKRSKYLEKGSKVLVPAVCWSTSVWPIIQLGMIPVFVDVHSQTLNMNLDKMEELLKNDNNIKGVVGVHIMGNCTNMERLINLVTKYDLLFMEDTCEALGSIYKQRYLGTFSSFGTFSFYYSHHITTVEGGMVTCDSDEDYELLKCLRAHGWSRFLKDKKEYEKEYPDIDPRFLFVNVGYNLRPMEIQGAMGLVQLSKLSNKNNIRNMNRDKIVEKILNHPKNKNIITSVNAETDCIPAWFNICFFLNEKYNYNKYLEYLTKQGIENRPVVTGNFVRQPAFKMLDLNYNPNDFPGAEKIHFRGFFIGASCKLLNEEHIEKIVDIMFDAF